MLIERELPLTSKECKRSRALEEAAIELTYRVSISSNSGADSIDTICCCRMSEREREREKSE